MSSKKITFSIPDWMYDGLKEHLSIINDSYRVEDLFKCAAINRFIQIGYLDEFGMPIPLPRFNDGISFGIGFDDLRLKTTECEKRGFAID